MNYRLIAPAFFALATLIPGIASAGRTIRIDNPGALCAVAHWGTVVEDPYLLLDGNNNAKESLPSFLEPGTVTTGDKVAVCVPKEVLTKIWATDATADPPNPASAPDPSTGLPTNTDLTAKMAIMYDWANQSPSPPLNFLLAPDAEVIVWSLPTGKTFGSGAFELELDNWCSPSPASTSGSQTPPNPTAAIRWNGNIYTAECAGFNSTTSPAASDLLLSRAGVLLGYVDQNNATHVSASAPGWTVSLRTGATLAMSATTVAANKPVTFEAVVAGLLGASVPTGIVTFFHGTTPFGTATLDAAGVAQLGLSGVAHGTYSVTASYGGDGTHASSVSDAQTLQVN